MESNKPPSVASVVGPPATSALVIALIFLVSIDIGVTVLNAMRSALRGDRIIDYQVDIKSGIGEIKGAVDRVEKQTRPR